MKLTVFLVLFFGAGVGYGANEKAMLAGIHKESCFVDHVIRHQKEILEAFSFQNYLSDEDALRVRLAKATLATESVRMAKLSRRFGKLTGQELTTERCE